MNLSIEQSLEVLENDIWKSPDSFPTELMRKIYLLRQRPIKDLDTNELRILISQNVGIKYLLPLAIEILLLDLFHEALYYQGDLLKAVLEIDQAYWKENSYQLNIILSSLYGAKSMNTNSDTLLRPRDVINSIDKFISKWPTHYNQS